MKWMVFLLASLLFAGCADPVDYEIRGSFTSDRTDPDIQELVLKVESLGGEVAIMESFPEQFVATFDNEDACDNFHNFVHLRAYVDQTVDNHCQIV